MYRISSYILLVTLLLFVCIFPTYAQDLSTTDSDSNQTVQVYLPLVIANTQTINSTGNKVVGIQDNAKVMVVEDFTDDVVCRLVYKDLDDVQDTGTETPCPAWSILYTHQMTYGEVKTANIPESQYVILTGDELTDAQQVDLLLEMNALKGHKDNVKASAQCTPKYKSIGQYVYWPNIGTGVSTNYETHYNIGNTCLVNDIADRMKRGSTSETIAWNDTNNSSGKHNRGINLNTSWSGWYGAGNAGIGQQGHYRIYFGFYTSYFTYVE